MRKVKLTTKFPQLPPLLLRQTPGGKGIWGDFQFFIDDAPREYDFWVVFEGLIKTEEAICPKRSMLFVCGEPPTVKTYSRKFLAQFPHVIASNGVKGRTITGSPQGNPWIIGMSYDAATGKWDSNYAEDYDSLKKAPLQEKTRLISTVVSTKRVTDGQAKRLHFMERLKNKPDIGIDIFGRGSRDIKDKRDAIVPYKYHIVLENGSCEDYWTEKLADSYLGGAYPFYWGCPNLSEFFPEGSYTPIDIENPEKAIDTIKKTIKAATFEKSQTALAEAKRLVLDRYNFFAITAGTLAKFPHESVRESITIKPEEDCRKRELREIVRKFPFARKLYGFFTRTVGEK